MAAVPSGVLENGWSKKAGETADQQNRAARSYDCFTRNVVKDLVVKAVGTSASEEVLQSQWTM